MIFPQFYASQAKVCVNSMLNIMKYRMDKNLGYFIRAQKSPALQKQLQEYNSFLYEILIKNSWGL